MRMRLIEKTMRIYRSRDRTVSYHCHSDGGAWKLDWDRKIVKNSFKKNRINVSKYDVKKKNVISNLKRKKNNKHEFVIVTELLESRFQKLISVRR